MISNEIIKVEHIRNGRVIKSREIKNRILDNYLEYMIARTIKPSVSNVQYPILSQGTQQYIPARYAYFNFDTLNVITDSSVTMTYNIKKQNDESATIITNGDDGVTYDIVYEYVVEASQVGKTLKGIGFGLDDTTYTNKWLLAWKDFTDLNIQTVLGDIIRISRIDTLFTIDATINGETYPRHLSSSLDLVTDQESVMTQIKLANNFDGTDIVATYNLDDLTFSKPSANTLSITGFTNLESDFSVIYPSILRYPSDDLYPNQKERKPIPPTQPSSVVFTYETFVNSVSQGTYDVIYQLLDIVDVVSGVVEMRLTYERRV